MPMHPEIHLTLFWPAGHHHPYLTERKPDVQVLGQNAHIYCFRVAGAAVGIAYSYENSMYEYKSSKGWGLFLTVVILH